MAVYSVYFIYLAMDACFYPLKDYVGINGCYFIDFMEIYGILVSQSISFYTSIFRYLCVVHQSLMLKLNLKPVTLVQILLCIQYSLPLLQYLAFRGAVEITSQNARLLTICLGRFEAFYNMESGFDSCAPTLPKSVAWFACNLSRFLAALISSNLFEMYLLGTCLVSARSQTNNVKQLLSLTAYQKRKRWGNSLLDLMYSLT